MSEVGFCKDAGHAIEEEQEDSQAPERPTSDTFTVFPDTLPMPISFGAVEQRCMLLKQLTCVGVRTWLEGQTGTCILLTTREQVD